jgi:hypothetical protein
MIRSFSQAACEESAVNTGWDVGRVSMADARRIATLAVTQGGRYLDDLWTLVEYALDERVRRFAYAQATGSARG